MTEFTTGQGDDPIQVTPVVVLVQVFPARPSSIPDIRDFVRRCLAESPLTEEGNREVGETVFRALLDAAGPTGSIQVAFRIFPEHVEVVLNDRLLDLLIGDMQLADAIPLGGVAAEIGLRGGGARGTHRCKPLAIARDHRVERIEAADQRARQLRSRSALTQPEERPGAFAKPLDQSSLGQKLEMT